MGKRAIILAGGKGTRLAPYTTVLPKPLLPVGEHAILEVVVEQLRGYGFTHLTLAVGYLAHLVRAVMQDGTHHGVTIDYHEEQEPLGTVGALATIDNLEDSFLAMNGDVLTSLDYGELLDIHRESGNLLTIASHRRVIRTEYGVLHVDDGPAQTKPLIGFEEKPEQPKSDLIPIGVYLFRPSVFEVIDDLKPSARGEFEITDLLNHYLAQGSLTHTVFEGDWQDAGTIEALLESNAFAATFAPDMPVVTGHEVGEVEAEPVAVRGASR